MKKTHVLMASLVVVLLVALSGVSRGEWDPPLSDIIKNDASVIQGVAVYGNTPWTDAYDAPNNGLGGFWMRGINNYGWYSLNQMAFTGFDSAIATIRVWTSPYDNTNMTGYTFKSSTTDWTGDPDVCNPAKYETNMGDFALPLVTYPAALAPGWGDIGETPEGYYNAYRYYYDFAVSAPAGTKSLLVHVDEASPQYDWCQYQGEIQAFAPLTGDLVIEKYNDLDGDGIIEVGEPPIPGWMFTVEGKGMFTTGVDGTVTVPDLASGDYTVVDMLPEGWTCTYDTDGPVFGTVLATVVGGQTTTVQFGNTSAVPEPAGLGLIGAALLALRKRRS